MVLRSVTIFNTDGNAREAAESVVGQGMWVGCLNALRSRVGSGRTLVQCASLCLCLFLGQKLRWGRAILKACECAHKSMEPYCSGRGQLLQG